MMRRGVDDYWLVRRVMAYLVEKQRWTIAAERYIMKNTFYTHLRYWRRYPKSEAREIGRRLAMTCPGVRFTNRGLFIPRVYLDAKQPFDWPRPPTRSGIGVAR